METEETEENMFTRDGNLRKRKKFNTSLKERNLIKNTKLLLYIKFYYHAMQIVKKKFTQNIPEERRHEINKMFWSLSWKERRLVVYNSCKRVGVKRRRGKGTEIKRNNSFEYHLTDNNSTVTKVCKGFFLTTLGYKKNNDRVIFDILHNTYDGALTPPSDKRKYNRPSSECSIETHDLVNTHIELFHPTISHYRREHDPNVRYLPSDINITLMHADFIEKYPNIQISYEFYRLKVKNISFETLGHAECEVCESFKLHDHTEENMQSNCEICTTKKEHTLRYKNSRACRKIFKTNLCCLE